MNEDLTLAPHEIEKKSFEILSAELGDRTFDPMEEPIIKRVIHTSADFSYADTLDFSPGAVKAGIEALQAGATVLTDTNMALAGISKTALGKLGAKALCFMADPDVAEAAKASHTTRAVVSMEKACSIEGPLVIAIGNAPTALLKICDLVEEGRLNPSLVIGVPVGFVNVVESKERAIDCKMNTIVARGRKGGSNIAAAIVNAIAYMITRKNGSK